MTLAWLLLLTGLTISAVAIYYSVVGLTAIFSAAAIPIIVMGSSLEIAKLVCASWLKANWERAPRFMKYYMITAVVVLMLITSMGIFGFLSKAHNDQNLVSGDVQSKIAIYDEKIKIQKDNIESARKALIQMDAAVDQTMSRSSDEKGADKASALRRSQAKERTNLQNEIARAQKEIVALNDARAPIAAEVRKVEAEVGPIKYIAKFIYGDHGADENMLEKAVTWIIIMIVIVFDPLAVIMLLAAQMTFGWYRKQQPEYEPDDGPLTEKQVEQVKDTVTEFEGIRTPGGEWIQTGPSFEVPAQQTHTEEVPSETQSTALGGDITAPEEKQPEVVEDMPLEQWNRMIEEAEKALEEEKKAQVEPDFPKAEESEESKKKTYMTKDETGKIQVKSRS